ncbi:HTH-type transcriptional repressor FabR [Pasteurella canis]|uniref:HTH-type transcriptional regulator n=1 Tax=Pasteurella canis TaxID=753 RepID=A0ABQ4VI05_9PAST|nr:HTH-type transcriptional repressor FabR [Pasteurella canis]MXN89243.1 HTH-type transcriptional repressor FabR [Pasteurella canis]UAX42070.1 HTH-type transcriptional repressor FabR [Pasteurella canis]UAY77623.1 HTH-type transcriptional repressor FabR [Pasteurella canis]UDW83644.1 HTH-type transcriptional repressor FabR [Pasteurella canis]UEA16716.1 HTH-type transcriptional repressor FabR [Pasteurella canis]
MAGVRALQKEKTRRALISAAFNQLTAEQSFSNLSLREVSREAGIAPTSFYRHFKDMDELGLTMVDEAGLVLRQLMRQARKRLEKGGSVIAISVDTFFEFITNNPNMFRLLLRESSGTSQAFRTATAREIKHFVDELTEYIVYRNHSSQYISQVQAEGMVTIVFTAGANALDMGKTEREQLKQRVILQLRMLAKGAEQINLKEIE